MFINNFRNIYLLIFVLINVTCRERGFSQSAENEKKIVNCYILKPVPNNSQYYWPNSLKFPDSTLDQILNRPLLFDSSLRYVTSFEFQKIIFFNANCYDKITNPDSSGLINIYFYSTFSTRTLTKSIIEYIQSYKANILNFGRATIFEYRFNGVAEVQSHYMYLILKDQTEDEKRYGEDYKGFVICSDGLELKSYKDHDSSIPLFKQKVKGAKEFNIVLYFDGNEFIPIGHFKSANWSE